jgi:hypothetical protein
MMQAVQAQTISAEDIATEIDRPAAMRQALTAVAQAGTFATVDDVSAWQRELRVDRAQPGARGLKNMLLAHGKFLIPRRIVGPLARIAP